LEGALAAQIRERRDHSRGTLIIWDVCYAKTFAEIGDVRFHEWPPNYVHLFSCQSHERTWLRQSADGGSVSLFSEQLAAVLEERPATWPALQRSLRNRLGALQTPEVVYRAPFEPGVVAMFDRQSPA
jgi:hypothetical protein